MLDLAEIGGRDAELRGEVGLAEGAGGPKLAKLPPSVESGLDHWRQPNLQKWTLQLCKFTFELARANGQGDVFELRGEPHVRQYHRNGTPPRRRRAEIGREWGRERGCRDV